jgi:glc operon protein GlcG
MLARRLGAFVLATCLLEAPASAQSDASLTLDQAWTMVQAARAYGTTHGFRLSIVVVDAGGHAILSARMDGAAFGTLAFSEGKAYASIAAGGLNGAQLIERYRAEPWIWGNAATMGGNGPMLPGAGTFPIKQSGTLIGAIAVSGAGPDDDDAAATAGLTAAHFRP